jgi:hypothetical protein
MHVCQLPTARPFFDAPHPLLYNPSTVPRHGALPEIPLQCLCHHHQGETPETVAGAHRVVVRVDLYPPTAARES